MNDKQRGKDMSNSGVAGPFRTTVLGAYLIVMSLFLVYVVYHLWPAQIEAKNGNVIWDESIYWFGKEGVLNSESRLILLVLTVGALGSYVHTATSFVSYVGNRSFFASWTWWYVLRPFIGMALAIIFYFVIRGGLMGNVASAADISPYGIAAVAGLVGMFSKQATDKLEELFNNLFKTSERAGDAQRGDKLGSNQPIRDVMIPRDRITVFVANDEDVNIPLTDIMSVIGPGITRVPVLEASGRLRYLIHQSILTRCLADWSGTAPPNLADLASDGETLAMIRDTIAFVAEDATSRDAKAAMESVAGCQDVIVTASGNRAEPVAGWVTNVDLGRILQV